MEVLKIAILFVSLACLAFGKFIEPKMRDTSESFEDTLEPAETLQDTELGQSVQRVNDYLSRFLETPAADDRSYRNMCKTKTALMRSNQLFGDSDKVYHPAIFLEKFCAHESDGKSTDRCGEFNYCVTQTMRMEFNERPRGSNAEWRRKRRTMRVGCSCMAPV